MSATHTVQWEDPAYRARMLEALRLANGRGDAVGYAARHDRLRAAYGKASEHSCVNCNEPAIDWSLNPDVSAERLRADADAQSQGLQFSLEDSDYSPRCRACHVALDGCSPVAAV
jgi:hypothetical protein